MKPIYLFSFLVFIAIAGCSSHKETSSVKDVASPAKASVVQLQELTGYFVKNTYQPANEVNPIVIKDQAQFNELVGIAKTMNNTIISPDFNKSYVIALILRATNKETTVKLSDSKINGEALSVYFTVKTGTEQSYTTTPIALSTVDKSTGVKTIQFFVNGQEKGVIVL